MHMTSITPVYLMSPPGPEWTVRARSNVFSQAAGTSETPLAPQARADWLMVAHAIERAGGRVLVAPPPPHLNLTGMPYTAEAGIFFRDEKGAPGFLLPNMKPAHRHAEATYLAGYVSALGWRARKVNATWEGQGDVLRVDLERMVHTWGEGPYARTSREAYAEVAHLISRRHIQVGFKADPWFHGNTFLGFYASAKGERRWMLVCPAALQDGELARLRAFVPEAEVLELQHDESVAYATNALQVNGTVIAPTGLPARVHEVWRSLGLEIVELPLQALFRQGGGAAVCLTDRLDGFDASQIPAHLTLSAWEAQS
ncbi:MAG: hypothetical protein AB2A00_40555 [Myxococcota bacterium]